ncbi:LacI family transcriptional regulator [Streptomyces sp. 8K308]|uniref:LacI family DNA-binding transcriptional regulator n=1 Tax=Streptomyces sp. 8K308 TaxID=2530388 RepID=UPI001046F8EE|nr:LacI family DNA-binding transcriptional regulator [Streptomyces sp. 8K308]TDC18334.1 LacI family transcriptional regulator [Streptomyces sp. 8K308]
MSSTARTTPVDSAPGEPLTIAQIAKRVGVSVATVSKVVNGRADVAPLTRSRIESVIQEHGYRRQKKSTSPAPLIDLLFHAVEGGYAIEIFQGVQRVAAEQGLAVVVSELRGRPPAGREWVDEVLVRRPTGVIAVFSGATGAQVDQLRVRGIPFVLLDPTGEPDHSWPSVGAGNWSGGLTATRHLLDLGHRRVAVITGPEDVLCARARLDGFRAAMDMAGAPVEPELVRVGDFRHEAGLRHGRELLRLPEPPTAVFAGNDGQALGVYRAAAEAGLRVPEDLSVVGFDDLYPSQWANPPLTTVRQPLATMAATAATMVLDLAEGRTPAQTRVELATELVLRGSTAPPRA